MTEFLYTIFIYPVYIFAESIFFAANNITEDYTGISIIILSLGINIITLPIYNVAEKWQEKERIIQQKMRVKIADIKAVFKGDEKYMILSTYYRQNNYHPLYSLRSLFALFIQIPFFIAAYNLLSGLPALHGTSFLFLDDLGQPDHLFCAGGITINVLPVIMTLINLAASAVYTKGAELKDKFTLYTAAFLFLVLLYNSPSGLVFYWTLNNLFSLLKNIFYKIKLSKKTWFLIALASAVLLTGLTALTATKRKPVFITAGVSSIIAFFPLVSYFIKRLAAGGKNLALNDDKKRFFIFFASTIALVSFIALVLPAFTMSSSPQEFANFDGFTNPLGILYYTCIQGLGICFYLVCLYKLFSKEVQQHFCFVMFFLLTAALLNAFVFTGNYGDINNFLVFEDNERLKHSAKFFMLNAAALAAAFFLSAKAVYSKFSSFLPSVLTIIVISFFTASGFSSISIHKEYLRMAGSAQTGKKHNNKSKAYKISKTGKNIFILMLDRSMNFFIEPIFSENESIKNEYTGFTLFNNTIAFAGNTNKSAPSLFGGYEYTPENMNKRKNELLVDKHNEAMCVLPRLFSENNWSVSFTDPPWLNYSWVPDLSVFDKYGIDITAENIDYFGKYSHNLLAGLKNSYNNSTGIKGIRRNMLYFSFFRILPSEIRRVLYANGNYGNVFFPQYIKMSFIDSYSSLLNLTSEIEFAESGDCINIIVNNITHEPPKKSDIIILGKEFLIPLAEKYCLNEYTAEHFYANYLAHEECAKFFRFLKENNCYGNSRIIIAGDHGRYSMHTKSMDFLNDFKNTEFKPEELIPLLMVKDFDALGEMKTDKTFMTLADIPFLTVRGLDEKLQNNPFTGIPFKESEAKTPAAVVIDTSGWQADEQRNLTQFKIDKRGFAFVKDNVYDPKNWSRAGD